ncbi:hypothetical protein [Amycolatopsis australiensis]|uniref:hypothetical protein n=1 Tax=Amycolatopsis australiensis TaxID=546364 RepID=UPI0015A6FC52|nr:hypothetical protein [Amycolatopsis australiensis]
MSDGAMDQLRAAGAVTRVIPGGPEAPAFEGQAFHIPASAFDLFNKLRSEGQIVVSP